MQKIHINEADPVVRFTPNIPGSLTPVYTITVPEKIVYSLHDGVVLVMKLKDATGAEIADTSDILLAGIRPGRKLPVEILPKKYRAFAALSHSEQYDNNKNGQLRLKIPRGRMDFLELHQLIIMVRSDDVVDPDESFFEIEVDESPYRDRA